MQYKTCVFHQIKIECIRSKVIAIAHTSLLVRWTEIRMLKAYYKYNLRHTFRIGIGQCMSTNLYLFWLASLTYFCNFSFIKAASMSFGKWSLVTSSSASVTKTAFSSLFHSLQIVVVQVSKEWGNTSLPSNRFSKLLFPAVVSPYKQIKWKQIQHLHIKLVHYS